MALFRQKQEALSGSQEDNNGKVSESINMKNENYKNRYFFTVFSYTLNTLANLPILFSALVSAII
jgi:hypothetical protein